MFVSMEWVNDFKEACNDIRTDTILLEGLLLRRAEGFHSLISMTDEVFDRTLSQLLDYLAQHTAELYRLDRKLEKSADPSLSET